MMYNMYKIIYIQLKKYRLIIYDRNNCNEVRMIQI